MERDCGVGGLGSGVRSHGITLGHRGQISSHLVRLCVLICRTPMPFLTVYGPRPERRPWDVFTRGQDCLWCPLGAEDDLVPVGLHRGPPHACHLCHSVPGDQPTPASERARPELPPQGKAGSSLSLTAHAGSEPFLGWTCPPFPEAPVRVFVVCFQPAWDLGWGASLRPKCEPGLTSAISPTHAPCRSATSSSKHPVGRRRNPGSKPSMKGSAEARTRLSMRCGEVLRTDSPVFPFLCVS